jgi:hypothetical protein
LKISLKIRIFDSLIEILDVFSVKVDHSSKFATGRSFGFLLKSFLNHNLNNQPSTKGAFLLDR